MGGSFDPIHLGHLIIAQDAIEHFKLDLVLFVPARQSPLKQSAATATQEHRFEMTRRAVSGKPRFAASDADLQLGSPSYSIDTVRLLQDRHADDFLFWILGADQIAQLHRWHKIEELARLVEFIAFERPGFHCKPDAELPPHVVIHRAPARAIDISSSEIRQRLRSGRDAKYFLPGPVFDYIKTENPYR